MTNPMGGRLSQPTVKTGQSGSLSRFRIPPLVPLAAMEDQSFKCPNDPDQLSAVSFFRQSFFRGCLWLPYRPKYNRVIMKALIKVLRHALRRSAAKVMLAVAIVAATAAQASDYPVRPVPLAAVRLHDAFWGPRLETNRVVTVWHDFKECQENGQLDNFAKAGGLMTGEFRARPPRDSDIYKIIEGASYTLATHPDPALEQYLDALIVHIAAAQEPDGYLYTARRLLAPEKMPAMAGPHRWLNEQHSHELYVAGHLYEAGVAYFQATGKRSLLEVAIKNADLVAKDFGPGRLGLPPGHEGIEIGLAKLYRATGDRKYLELDRYLIDLRGRPETHALFGPYCQDHQPVTEQSEAVGHAVRAAYLYGGVCDVDALTGDGKYGPALDRLWNDVVARKLSITGGIGPRREGESFGAPYELPNARAYNETCGALANALWNYRMFLRSGDGRYLEVFERVLYNGFLSGVSLSGDRFFYENPLASPGGYQRAPWFGTPCCPVNIVRFLPAIPGCVYAVKDDALYVNLFMGSTANVRVGTNTVSITQTTRYPWDGRVQIAVNPERAGEFTLCVRIPGWTQNRPVPSDLYRFADTNEAPVELRLNGQPVKPDLQHGFARLAREWKRGDAIELNLPMPIRRVLAHPAVKDDAGLVALQRGPLVYCAEGADNDGHALKLVLGDDAQLSAEERPELLGGITTIRAAGAAGSRAFTAIPYYAWANRGGGEMTVWFARQAPGAAPSPP